MISATSDPLAKVHEIPHRTCVASSAGNDSNSPVASIAVPISTWEMTSDHLRLIVSAMTPAGTSKTSANALCTDPISTSWAGESPASTTR